MFSSRSRLCVKTFASRTLEVEAGLGFIDVNITWVNLVSEGLWKDPLPSQYVSSPSRKLC